MKIIKRILLGLAVLVVLVILAGLFFLKNLQKSAIPDYNKDVKLGGVITGASILRDSFGIPHIEAQNENDLYVAVGFAMAQDRLWQMDLLRRVTQGRLSEILGKEQVNTDLLLRSLRFEEKSEKIMDGLSPDIKAALEAFSAGVNQYMAYHPLPPEFKILGYHPEPWQPVHSVNLIGYMAWDLSSGWGMELLLEQLKTKTSAQQIAELIPDLLHVHPGAMRVALRAVPQLYCVTDATAAAAMPDGEYRLGRQVVSKCGGGVRLPDGTLAGSTLTMDQALRNLVDGLGLGLREASACVSTHAANYLGLNDRGVLRSCALADVVVLDARLRLLQVFVEGCSVDLAATT